MKYMINIKTWYMFFECAPQAPGKGNTLNCQNTDRRSNLFFYYLTGEASLFHEHFPPELKFENEVYKYMLVAFWNPQCLTNA